MDAYGYAFMADWLTYSEVAKHLSLSAEAVRQRAIRGRWQRTRPPITGRT